MIHQGTYSRTSEDEQDGTTAYENLLNKQFGGPRFDADGNEVAEDDEETWANALSAEDLRDWGQVKGFKPGTLILPFEPSQSTELSQSEEAEAE